MIYAMGDIHGQRVELEKALRWIEADGGRDARIIFLGDYTDRGPDSRGVLEILSKGLAEGRNWVALKGNHDRMFERFLEAGDVHDDRISSGKGWLHPALGGQRTLGSYDGGEPFLHPMNGGLATLLAYGVEIGDSARKEAVQRAARDSVPERHRQFVAGLPLWHQEEGFTFVHAGIRPGVPMAEQAEDDLLWIRDGFLEDTRDHGTLIVHGHTALERPTAYPNRVNLDGGAGFGRPLLPAVFDDGETWLLTGAGRERLEPALL